VPKHRLITRALRARILRGELGPGTVLPTTQQLAEQFQTSAFTVQTGLAPLVAEGLVERKPRVGTVVRHNAAVLTCAGIYCSGSLMDEWEYAFARELCRQLQCQLREQNVRTLLHMDSRPQAEQHEPPPELADAVETNRLQALFAPLCDQVSVPWLTQLPVTSSFVCSAPIPNRVGFDTEQILQLGLDRLREQGCNTVGLISAIQIATDSHTENFRFYDAFVSAVSELGLTTRDAWVRTTREHVVAHEPYGYESFKALWEHPERPDGILVYPDTSARGAMTAALELRVRVPEELRLVFHRNTGVDWVCPLPVDRVESNVARWAAEMIAQVRRQKAGETVEPVVLPYQLVIA